MHIFFSGIGGTGIGPLALIAHEAGYTVSGSDKQESQYIDYLRKKGIKNISIGQSDAQIEAAHKNRQIDWIVYSSSVSIENPNHPELLFAKNNDIKLSKRDELLNKILQETGKQLIAIAGTHGKTTTTAMAIWLFKELELPISYSVGAKIPFGDMGEFNSSSEYFVYECDEFDRNFLAFNPTLSLITGIDYDHHDIFPTQKDYQDAFKQFLDQTQSSIVWQSDLTMNELNLKPEDMIIDDEEEAIDLLKIVGHVNRRNAWQVIQAVHLLTGEPVDNLIPLMERFPGLSRRFEKVAPNLYSDYAHTIPKIEGCLQMAHEISDNVVVVYEPLTNRRQHYIKQDYKTLFQGVKKLYWVPSYLAREDSNQEVLNPADLIEFLDNKEIAAPAKLNNELKSAVLAHLEKGDLVVCLSGGGGGSLDEWLRKEFSV